MKLFILFGPPGAGKGTHAGAIAEKYNLKHLSTGALLRSEIAAGTALGKEAKNLIEKGCLVPDEVVEGMISGAFDSYAEYDGFLLDGFPRTLAQAEHLDEMLKARGAEVNGVISIMISDQTVIKRIKGRALVEGRADDADEKIIQNRIDTYHLQTEPIIDFYKAQGKYHEVDTDKCNIEESREKVLALAESLN